MKMMVTSIIRKLAAAPEPGAEPKKRHKLLLMIDEFPTLGKLSFLESALAYIDGFGIRALLVTQSIAQLKSVYGERTPILENINARVFYTPKTVEAAEYISRSLGDKTASSKSYGESGQKGSPFYSNKNESTHYVKQPLMSATQIMKLPNDQAIILMGGANPIKAKKSYYDQDSVLKPMVNYKDDNEEVLKPPPTIKRLPEHRIQSAWLSPTVGIVDLEIAKNFGKDFVPVENLSGDATTAPESEIENNPILKGTLIIEKIEEEDEGELKIA